MMRRRLSQVQKLLKANCKTSGTKFVGTTFNSRLALTDCGLWQQMTLKEAQILTLRVLKQVMEEKLDHHNVQLAQVSSHPSDASFRL
jgi:hypothetical protein